MDLVIPVLVKRWWLVVATPLIFLILAYLWLVSQPDQFEARTRLLIVQRISEQTTVTESASQGLNLSVDTLSALATSRGLLRQVIGELDIPPAEKAALSVGQLSNMIRANIETSGRPNAPSSLPLLTMTVKGEDPVLLQKIAAKWGEVFQRENAELFISEAALSFDFLQDQYNQTKTSLTTKQNEKVNFQRLNPLPVLETRQRALLLKYEEGIALIETKTVALAAAQARLQSAQEAIAKEPQFIELKRSIPNDAIWTILGANPNQQIAANLSNLFVIDQTPNSIFLSLRNEIVQANSNVATLSAELTNLNQRTAQMNAEITALNEQIASAAAGLSILDRELNVASDNFQLVADRLQIARIEKAEQAGSVRIVEEALVPELPVGPGKFRVLAFTAIAGLLIGTFLAFLFDYVRVQGKPQVVS